MSLHKVPEDLRTAYKESFFAKRKSLLWRVPIVCKAIAQAIDFSSVIDLGCANGDLVAGFREIGKQSFGVEGSREASKHLICDRDLIFFRDLRRPLDKPGQEPMFSRDKTGMPLYGLAMALEVAEHIEKGFAKQFVSTLINLSDNVLVSTAPPGQKGHYHVNCQPVEYWDHIFACHGYCRRDEVADQVRAGWAGYGHKAGIKAYEQNLHFYRREIDGQATRHNYDSDFAA